MKQKLSHISDRAIALALFLLVAITGIFLAPRIGPAWDEPDNMFAGGVYWNFFLKGFDTRVFNTNDSASSYFGGRIYPLDRYLSHLPPVYNYVGTAFAVIAESLGAPKQGATVIVAYHISTVLFFALLVATTYMFGVLLSLPRWASVFAALATFLYPTLFGHGLSNSKDAAQAALFIVSLYLLTKGALHRIGHDIVLGAIAWGLGLATKFNAIYVPIIWGLWLASRFGKPFFNDTRRDLRGPRAHLRASLSEDSPPETRRKNRFSLRRIFSAFQNASLRDNFSFFIFHFSFFIVIGILTAFVVWPYLWFDPINRAMEVVRYFTTVGQGYKFFWEGVEYQAGIGTIYWWYPIASLLYSTPLALIGLIVFGMIVVFGSLKRIPTRTILFLWIAVPLGRAFLPTASLYDQLRHFVEILPACMIVAAIGLDQILRVAPKKLTPLVYGFIVFVIGQLVVINAMYFPYSTGYYNVLAGNPNTRFDRDVEALSVKEGMDYLHRTYGAVRVWVPIGGHLAWYYVDPADQYVYSTHLADSLILINKSSHVREDEFTPAVSPGFAIDHVIRRGDAIFGWVYRKVKT